MVREQVLDELVRRRQTVDHVFHGVSEGELRSLFDVLLGKMAAFAADRDPRGLRSYLRRWVALRVGAGARHENLIPALVAVGDTAIEVARDQFGDTDEIRALMRTTAQANFIAARVVVEVLADEYHRRRTQIETMAEIDA